MEYRITTRDKRMPTFLVELWNTDNYDADFTKRRSHLLKRMWAGRIEHLQSKKHKMFTQISQMLEFIENNRV